MSAAYAAAVREALRGVPRVDVVGAPPSGARRGLVRNGGHGASLREAGRVFADILVVVAVVVCAAGTHDWKGRSR